MSPNLRFLAWFDRRTARALVAASGAFSAILAVGLVWNGLKFRVVEDFETESVLAMKAELRDDPGAEDLKTALRAEDLDLRQDYFQSLRKLELGGSFLFGGLLVFVLSLRRYSALTQPDPIPVDLELCRVRTTEQRRSLLATLAIPMPLAVGTLLAYALVSPVSDTENGDQELGMEAVSEIPELPESMKWPGFRGNGGRGVAVAMDLPLAWDFENEENLLWKTPIPLKGNSSPIVWGDRIFLTGADADDRRVFCFNAEDGSLLWDRAIRTPVLIDEEMKKNERMGDSGFASPTPATDGKQVYAFFGTGEMVAFDYEGNQVWSRWLGKPNSFFGLSTSPLYHEGKVILQLDQGDEDEPDSYLYAFNAVDGGILWKVPREVPSSWSSPILVGNGDAREILTAGNPWVISYDPKTGAELWRAEVLRGDVAPVPAYSEGVVYSAVEYSQLSAVRTGGRGDVSESHLLWTYDEDLPDVPSLVTDGTRVLLPTSYGQITCLNVKDGTPLWEQDLDGEFWASPILVGENIYWTDMEGVTFIFELADRFESLGGGRVGERVVATPAFADSKIWIRGERHLFCVGKKLDRGI